MHESYGYFDYEQDPKRFRGPNGFNLPTHGSSNPDRFLSRGKYMTNLAQTGRTSFNL